jgi:SAM-dependent methyltransferase
MATLGHEDPFHGTSAVPGAGLDTARMPAHWLLARLGKRVLRPGGVELTDWMLDALRIGPEDHVVELAAGLGATAVMTLARRPASYTAVDRDSTAVTNLSVLAAPGRTHVHAVQADAAYTGLPSGTATVVYGEAMLSMHPETAKRRVIREARRLLDHSHGRYGIHELCLLPDDLAPELAQRIGMELGEALHVGARPLTARGWTGLLSSEGFAVTGVRMVPMALLEPWRLAADEGFGRALVIVGRALRDPVARRRLLHIRKVFHRHRDHLGAIALVARPTSPFRSGPAS